MEFQDWLGPMPRTEFVERWYFRQPQSGRCTHRETVALGTWEVAAQILASPGADTLVVRNNEQRPGDAPRTRDEAESLLAEGYTLLVRHAERQHAGLRQLAAAFARDFAAPVNIHLYVTPPESFGFAWHYDAEEVFILQTGGAKEYSLRKNTVNPWPVEETLPANMQYEREIMPLMKCTLAAGDWLYIPSGWWHKAVSQRGDTAISLAIGVMARTGIDVFRQMQAAVLDSLLWRQRLPVLGDASPLSPDEQRAALEEVLRQLAAGASQLIASAATVDSLLSLAQRDRNPTSEMGASNQPSGS